MNWGRIAILLRLTALLLLGFGTAAPASAASAQRIVVQLPYEHQFQFAGVYAALWQGLYRQAGLEVEIRSALATDGSVRRPLDELLAGRAQFAIAPGGTVVASPRVRDLVVVCSIFQRSGMRGFFRMDNPVSSLADLKRVRIARNEGNPLLDIELAATLKAEGLSLAGVQLQAVLPAQMPLALVRREADLIIGYSLSTPWLLREAGLQEFGVFDPSRYGVEFYGDSLVVTAETAEADPEMVARFRDATMQGWRYAMQNSAEISDRVSTELLNTLPISDVTAYNRAMIDGVRELLLWPMVPLFTTSPDRWRRMGEQIANAGLIEQPPDVGRLLFDPRRLQEAEQYRVRMLLGVGLMLAMVLILGSLFWILALRREVRVRSAAMERSAAALLRSQHLEALGRLNAGIAHDFNNLLAIVVGNLDALLAQTLSDPLRRRAETALRAADRGTALTRQLRSVGRRPAATTDPLDLAELMTGFAPLLQRILGEKIELELCLPLQQVAARIDRGRLESMLVQMAANARDAMPDGGRATLRLQAAVDAPCGEGKECLELEFSDTGAGMSAEVAERAAEPFFSTKAADQANGLGLTQLSRFVADAGGTMRIESALGAGTSIRIFLPRSDQPRHAEPGPPAPARSIDDKRVLLVDDDDEVRATAEAQLRQLGCSVVSVADGASALAVLERGDPVDILFTDVVMRGMDGLELAVRARALRPSLPVVLATGDAERESHVVSGAVLLAKPFRTAEVTAALHQARRGAPPDLSRTRPA